MIANDLVVDIQLASNPGALKAHADVRIQLPEGSLHVLGFSVIEKDGKPAWVGFPQKQGRIPGKYFPVVKADGELEKRIAGKILEAYQKAKSI